MGEKNLELSTGTFYINGQEYNGALTDCDFENYIVGVWYWVLKNCPDRRVKHLMMYGKNKRVQYKNYLHACRLITKNSKGE